MKPSVKSIFEKTHKFKGEISDLVTGFEYPIDNKSQILLAYKSLIAEHHTAIFLLIQNDLNGSAFSLVRSLYEPFYRAHWIVGCATEEQIDKVLKGKDVFPKMCTMVEEIDTAFGLGTFFQNIKKNSWGPMNDYTHSGLRQISRRFDSGEVSPNYETEEIIEVLHGLNIVLFLMTVVFFKFFGKDDAAKEVERILSEYIRMNEQSENS